MERIKEFELVTPMLFKSGPAEFKDQKVNIFVTGIEPDHASQVFEELNIGFREGAAFESESTKIILGPRLSDDLYDDKILLGDKIKIMNRSLQSSRSP